MWHTTWKNGLKCRNLTLMEVGQKVCRLPITIPFQDLIQSSSDRVTAFVGQQESRDIKIAHVCRYAQKKQWHFVHCCLVRGIDKTHMSAVPRQQSALPLCLMGKHKRSVIYIPAQTAQQNLL